MSRAGLESKLEGLRPAHLRTVGGLLAVSEEAPEYEILKDKTSGLGPAPGRGPRKISWMGKSTGRQGSGLPGTLGRAEGTPPGTNMARWQRKGTRCSLRWEN